MDAAVPVPDTEVIRLLKARGTVRQFKPDLIPDSWVEALISSAQRAPTSSNLQSYSIIAVRNNAIKAKLAALGGNQQHIVDCPVFFVFCADMARPSYVCELHGAKYPAKFLEAGLVASLDATLAGMTMSIVADSMGLGSVMIGAMRNNPKEVADTLKLPPKVYAVFGLCVGFPKAPPLPKPRLPLHAVAHFDTYDVSKISTDIPQYNRELAAYYGRRGLATPEQAWTQPIAEKFSSGDRRKHLRKQLNDLGFEME